MDIPQMTYKAYCNVVTSQPHVKQLTLRQWEILLDLARANYMQACQLHNDYNNETTATKKTEAANLLAALSNLQL